ncbi:MAG: hypothetical protein IPN76_32095 [Saprospiraceae bacterium]|nr:hypothetical protein [Saprospiraceae bacterium]
MKTSYLLIYCLLSLLGSSACFEKNHAAASSSIAESTKHKATNPMESKIKLKIGTKTFTATLYGNEAATAFKAMLPLTLNMVELNGNEKYAALPSNLPTSAANPGKIQSGDLMLYGASTLVVFYETFSTSYSYTKLGRLEDVAGLAEALGSGNVAVGFEMEQ